MIVRKEKIDLRDRSKDDQRLAEAKPLEQHFKGKLERVEIPNGYVMTTNTQKWKTHQMNGYNEDIIRIHTTFIY